MLQLSSFSLSISMLQIFVSGPRDNMVSHQPNDVSDLKSVDGWKDALSLMGGHVRKRDLKSPL